MSVTINGNGTVTGLSALPTSAMATGSIVQAKHLQFTTDLAFTASSTTDVSGFSLSITPTSTSNDIIIILHCTMGLNCDGRMGLKRNGTVIETQIIGTGRDNLLRE